MNNTENFHRPKIKIYVACHKESELPKNPLYVPIHVGAALSSKILPNTIRDDSGENISTKNFSYCELTAQYWAWKNDKDSDYIGLCHYRRFLCFADISKLKCHFNERSQIEAFAIDDFNINRFGLENYNEISEAIKESDAVVGLNQTVSKLHTPRGFKKTAYNHWAAHDRDFLLKKDLDRMLELLEQENPKLGKYARKYLAGRKFLGFNTFVMKRHLFNELCNIEFNVLEKLEQEIDFTNYSQQQSRVFGFMGEIIFSSYVYMLEKEKSAKVKHVPLLYFDYTDKIESYQPISNAIPMIFIHRDQEDFLLGTALESLSRNLENDKKYDVLILSKQFTPLVKTTLENLLNPFKNLTVRVIDFNLIKNQMLERYGNEIDYTAAIPFILKNYEKVIVFSSNVLFNRPISRLWDENKNEKALICATKDCLMQGKVKDINSSFAEDVLAKYLENPIDYYNFNSFVMNLEEFRKLFAINDVVKICKKLDSDKISKDRFQFLALNIICQGKIKQISQNWACWSATNFQQKFYCQKAPLNTFQEYSKIKNSPAIFCYEYQEITHQAYENFDFYYWESLSKTSFYQQLLQKIASNESSAIYNEIKNIRRYRNPFWRTVSYLKKFGLRQTLIKISQKIKSRIMYRGG